MLNREAAAVVVAAMQHAGHLSPVDTAAVNAVLSLAAAVDELPGDARLWGQYQAALKVLRECAPEVESDEIAELVAALRGATAVVDKADRPADVGRGARKGRRAAV